MSCGKRHVAERDAQAGHVRVTSDWGLAWLVHLWKYDPALGSKLRTPRRDQTLPRPQLAILILIHSRQLKLPRWIVAIFACRGRYGYDG
jgi:hypothetical protein